MTKPVRAAAAVAFVAAVGVVLASPIIRGSTSHLAAASGNGPHRRRSHPAPPFPSPTPTPPPPPSPSPTPTAAPRARPSPSTPDGFETIAGPYRKFSFDVPYPDECLTPPRHPHGTGLLAGFDGRATSSGGDGRVTVRAIGGGGEASFDAPAPLGWSPSGKYLAAGDRLLDRNGADEALVGARLPDEWAWSPAGDCVIGLDPEDGLTATSAVDGTAALVLDRDVVAFSISPDGKHMGLAIAHGPHAQDVWIANLQTNTVAEVDRAPRDGWTATLGPWSADGTRLFYWRPDSVLRSVDSTTPPNRIVYAPSSGTRSSRVPVDPEGVVDCGGDVLAIVGSGRDPARNRRLAIVRPNARPALLTPSHDFVYSTPQCSPDGQYIAVDRAPAGSAPGDRHLVILDRRGTLLQDLTPAGDDDSSPMWGPSGTGLLFVRSTGAGSGEVWFAREGSSPTATGLTISDDYEPYVRKYGWESLLDWSATPPTGLPS